MVERTQPHPVLHKKLLQRARVHRVAHFNHTYGPEHPHVDDIVDALKACHRRSEREVEQMAQQAREHALEYDVDHVMEHYMLPALAEVERRYGAKEPKLVAA